MCVAVSMCATAQDSIQWVSDTMLMADSVTVEEIPSVTATAPQEPVMEQTPEKTSSGLGWLVMACGLTALLAVGAGVMAFMARREVAELREAMRTALEQTNDNMRKLAMDGAREMNALKSRQSRTQYEPTRRSTVGVEADETRVKRQGPKAKPTGPHIIYLAKPDTQDCFTRPSEHFELGNSLFELTTADEMRGTFVVIDNADVHRFALMMPTDNLTRACTGENIQLSTGKTRIVTDQPGEAIFEQGVWRITRKAMIHYV